MFCGITSKTARLIKKGKIESTMSKNLRELNNLLEVIRHNLQIVKVSIESEQKKGNEEKLQYYKGMQDTLYFIELKVMIANRDVRS